MVHADVMLNPDGTSKGWGVVQYASAQDAMGAIQVGRAKVVVLIAATLLLLPDTQRVKIAISMLGAEPHTRPWL